MATAKFEQDGIPVGELSLANGMFHATANILQAVFAAPARVAVEDPCFLKWPYDWCRFHHRTNR